MGKSVANSDFYVVAIGASAGGLEAYSLFFDNARHNKSVAYILIQHLAPDYKSLLVELLGKHTEMEIKEATHKVRVKPGCVYVIPPKKSMTISNGLILLNDKDPGDRGPNTSVDTFFNSLAETFGEKAIGVVLSGTGSDGSRGIEAVKQRGGLVIVQDPNTAKFDGMPKSSIATGCADIVVPVEQMYSEIASYISGDSEQSHIQHVDKPLLQSILREIELQTGTDFQNYKLPTIVRRLNKRLAMLGLSSMEEYLNYITNENTDEANAFIKDVLIGVTKFFRDPEAFESLRENVLLPLVKSKRNHETIKIWVTACSTGEEVYTIAMIIDDLLRDNEKSLDVKIFGTDLNSSYLNKAAKGMYDRSVASDIPADLFKRYFIETGNNVTVVPSLRKQIVFARHNIITDPPFIKNDLVCCRNMLIYMNKQLQKNVLAKFVFSVNMNGYIFLGPSEQLHFEKDVLLETDRKWKIYQKVKDISRKSFPVYDLRKKSESSEERGKKRVLTKDELVKEKITHALLEDFGITSFLIDHSYIIQEVHGDHRKFVTANPNDLRQNLLDILPENLSIATNTGVLKVLRHNEPFIIRNVLCKINNGLFNVTVSIRPFNKDLPFILVSYNSSSALMREKGMESEANAEAELPFAESELLKAELKETRFNLQTAIEELETTNEELQSSNEELLSANEELQSSNEELQSLNEELHTLNSENQQRIKDLIILNDDLSNYFRGSDIGQIILDPQKRIRKFNPAAAKLINIIEKDIERPITDLSTNFFYPDFERDIQEVILKNTSIEKEVILDGGKAYLIRLHTYITQEGKSDGALITFIDISSFKELNNIIEGVYKASEAGILVFKTVYTPNGQIKDFKTVSGNKAANEIFKMNLSGSALSLEQIHPVFYTSLYTDMCRVVETGTNFSTDLELEGKWYHIVGVRIPNGIALTLNDVSEQKESERKLRNTYVELYASKEALREVNNNLEGIVAQRTRELAVSEERFRMVAKVTNDVVIDWNFANDQFWVSENYYKLFGYMLESVLNNREFWLSKIHPSDRDKVIGNINAVMQKGSGIWHLEYRYMHVSGSYRNISETGFIIQDENGTPYRALTSMLDITELRMAERQAIENENRFQMAIETSDTAGWDIDLITGEFNYSKNLPQIFGHPAGVKFSRSAFRSQIHPEDRYLMEKATEEALKTGEYFYNARFIWPDKSVHWLSARGRVMYDAGNKPIRLLGILRDFTSEKNETLQLEEQVNISSKELLVKNKQVRLANEKLKKLNEELKQSNDDLEQFAYIASHDLQEPLRKIRTFISIIRDNKSADFDSYFEKISLAAKKMSELIESVLEYSRLSATKYNFSDVDLNEILQQVTSDFEINIRERNANVKIEKLPVVKAIPHQMVQLFYNLISNALKFSKDKPEIVVKSKKLTAEEVRGKDLEASVNYYLITVKDNGIGFDQKYAEDIFAVFHRLNGAMKPGSGIGLAICKKIVQKHHGLISAKSAPNSGAEFSIILPDEIKVD